jgi:hypothetical protein
MNTLATRGLRVAVLATFVVVVALAGTATAGKLITGKQIKNGTITGVDLRDGSVTGTDVKDKSLTEADFTGSLEGPQGPRGEAGPQGPQGSAGLNGAANLEYRVQPEAIPSGSTRQWAVSCPSGKRAVGGGVSSSNTVFVRMLEASPLNNGTGWYVGLKNEHSSTVTGYAWVACVTAP